MTVKAAIAELRASRKLELHTGQRIAAIRALKFYLRHEEDAPDSARQHLRWVREVVAALREAKG